MELTPGRPRHRLIHGEYFMPDDSGKNYVELIHRKVMVYFNDHVLREPLLDLAVVNPQRHPWGSLEGGGWFIRTKSPVELSLKGVLADFTKNGVNHLEHHELVYDGSLAATY